MHFRQDRMTSRERIEARPLPSPAALLRNRRRKDTGETRILKSAVTTESKSFHPSQSYQSDNELVVP